LGAVLATLATLVILVLGGAFAVPYLVDWNDYRDVFQAQASRLMGRNVDVRGDVSLTILPVPQIAFQNVRIADETGGFDAAIAEVQSFDMMLSLPALLTGAVEASSISLVKPVLRLSIDQNGQGNWRNLGMRDNGQIGPRAVALNGVAIKDGVIEITEADSGSIWRATSITGTFAADSLQGPFKFNGAAMFGGLKHDVRFGAAKYADGKLNTKVSAQSAGGAQYAFDGALSGLDDKPQYSGGVSLKSAVGSNLGYEAKARANLSLAGLEFTDLTLTVADNVRPQTVTGTASITRGAQPTFNVQMAGDWFNADPFLSAGSNETLPEALNSGLRSFREAIGGAAEGRLRLSVAQLMLRGDDLRDVSLDINHSASGLDITSLRALAPGDSDIRLSGRVNAASEAANFEGAGEISGSSLSRFLKWSGGFKDDANPALAKNFALKGKVSLNGHEFRIGEAAGELGSSALTGHLQYAFADRGALSLSIESDRLDLREVISGDLNLSELAGGASKDTDVDPQNGITLQSMLVRFQAFNSAKIKIRAGVLEFDDQDVKDVLADISAGGDSLTITALQFATGDGLRMKATGKLQSLQSAPEGEIKLSIDAAGENGVWSLARAAGLRNNADNSDARASMLVPLKIAGSLKARGAADAIDFKLDGLASDSPFSVEGRFQGENSSSWRGDVTVDAWISNADGGKLLAQILPGSQGRAKLASTEQGTLSIIASGRLNETLQSKVTLRTANLKGAFSGQASLMKTPWEASGNVRIESANAATSGMMSQLLLGRPVISEAFSAQADTLKTENTYTLSGLALDIGGAVASGSAKVVIVDGAPLISASLETDRAATPDLFAMLLDTSTLSPAVISTTSDTIWPDAPFSPALFEGVRHSLSLKSRRLELGAGLTLEQAELIAALERGALVVSKLEGDTLGGRFSAQGSLKHERGRFALNGKAGLRDARLEALLATSGGSGAPPLASGAVSLDARFSGQGATPRGMISNLSGKGSLRFGQGVLYKFSPGAPERLAREFLESKESAKAGFEKTLTAYIRQGEFGYRRLRAPFVIKNGLLKVRRASFRGSDYAIRSEIDVDLPSLRADSEWSLGVRSGRKQAETPTVKAIFAGPLAELSTLKLSIEMNEFERFLTVRRMERDLENLDWLNQYGRTPPPEAAPQPPGPRIENRKSPPFAGQPPGSQAVERQPLPPLPDAPPPRAADVQSWKPTPQSDAGSPVIQEKSPGAFEAKIRSAITNPPLPSTELPTPSEVRQPQSAPADAQPAPYQPSNTQQGNDASQAAQTAPPKPKRSFNSNEPFNPFSR